MGKKYIDDIIDNPEYSHRVFLSSSNSEIRRQLRLLNWSENKINNLIESEMLIGTLLSDLLIQPTAHYYDPKTRKLMISRKIIFEERFGIFVLGEGIEDYNHDAEMKKIEYPSSDSIYRDKVYLNEVVNELEGFGEKIVRRGSVGVLTGKNWEEALNIDSDGGGNDIIAKIKNSPGMTFQEKSKLIENLPTLPYIRGNLAFDWDYVDARLKELEINIPDNILYGLRRKLLHCYLSSCSQLYKGKLIYCSNTETALYPCGDKIELYDLKLFLDVMKILGINEIILNLRAEDIVDIKRKFNSFKLFRNNYFEIIESARGIEDHAIEQFREEIEAQEYIEKKQIRREILETSKPILVECIKEMGISKNPSMLYYPKRDEVYQFKKTLIDYEDIPFIRFRDDLIWNYETKLKNKIKETILKQKVSTEIYINCNFNLSQFGNNNNVEYNPKLIRRGTTVSKFVFNKGVFNNCQFGDHNNLNNYVDALNHSLTANLIDSTLKDALVELRKGIEYSNELNNQNKAEIVDALNNMSTEIIKTPNDQDRGKLRKMWDYVKEGVQVSYHLTSAVFNLGKLLGFL